MQHFPFLDRDKDQILIYDSYFRDEFIAEGRTIRSVLDYDINITKLAPHDQYYVALTGRLSVTFLEHPNK